MTAATHKTAVIFQVPDTDTYDGIAFRTAAAATPVPLTVRLEGVSASDGTPDGTLVDANATGTQGGNVAANTVQAVSFAAGVALTRGQWVACLTLPSTSPVSVQMASVGPTGGAWPGAGVPYAANFGASWSKTLAAGFPMIALRKSSGAYAYPGGQIPLIQAFTSRSISTSTGATTGTRRGNRLRLDADFEVTGVWCYAFFGSAGDGDFVLYDDGGSVVATLVAVDASRLLGTGNIMASFRVDTPITLSASTWYRLAFVPSSANSVGLYEASTLAAEMLRTLTGEGIEVQQAAYVSSAWVDTATSMTLMGLLGTAQSAPGGGGGGTYTAAQRLVGGGLVG
jgi:hypothetical protein